MRELDILVNIDQASITRRKFLITCGGVILTGLALNSGVSNVTDGLKEGTYQVATPTPQPRRVFTERYPIITGENMRTATNEINYKGLRRFGIGVGLITGATAIGYATLRNIQELFRIKKSSTQQEQVPVEKSVMEDHTPGPVFYDKSMRFTEGDLYLSVPVNSNLSKKNSEYLN